MYGSLPGKSTFSSSGEEDLRGEDGGAAWAGSAPEQGGCAARVRNMEEAREGARKTTR
jgi:hypothetical protein